MSCLIVVYRVVCYSCVIFFFVFFLFVVCFFCQAEDGIRDLVRSRGLGDVYKRQVLADLDGDLRQDILISGSDPNVGWFEQQANGNFSSLLPIYDEEIFGEAVDATDLDGDGDIDIVAATSFGTGLVWIENLGGSEFATAQIITSIDYPIDDMELVDLNQDGMKDILVSSYSATDQLGTVHWLQNLGGGSFGFPNIVTTSAREVKKLETADLNGDGLVDIVLASYWDYRMVWHANLGGGLFSSAQFIRPVNDSILNHGVVALDIDLDLSLIHI